MTTIKEITDIIEQWAPLSAQSGFDNSGLIVGDNTRPVRDVLLCVDITEEVMDEAQAIGAGMVISHHPIVFHPLKHITATTYVERVVERAIKGDIALYACHTNLDAVAGGMSYRLAGMLGLQDMRTLDPREDDPALGFGVVGVLPKPVPTGEFMERMKRMLDLAVIRHSDLVKDHIRKVALCTGSGSSLIGAAKRAGADIYIAADFRYNDFLDADRDLVVADIGHFESEYCAIDLMHDIIRKKIPTFALHKSKNSRNPVNYMF